MLHSIWEEVKKEREEEEEEEEEEKKREKKQESNVVYFYEIGSRTTLTAENVKQELCWKANLLRAEHFVCWIMTFYWADSVRSNQVSGELLCNALYLDFK